MKKRVSFYAKCMKCGDIKEYILRNEDVNQEVSDKYIYKKINESENKPYFIGRCEICKLYTLKMIVAWDY